MLETNLVALFLWNFSFCWTLDDYIWSVDKEQCTPIRDARWVVKQAVSDRRWLSGQGIWILDPKCAATQLHSLDVLIVAHEIAETWIRDADLVHLQNVDTGLRLGLRGAWASQESAWSHA